MSLGAIQPSRSLVKLFATVSKKKKETKLDQLARASRAKSRDRVAYLETASLDSTVSTCLVLIFREAN